MLVHPLKTFNMCSAQLYVSCKLGSGDLLSSAKSSIEICVQEINDWMIFNGVKLNEEKN